MKQYLYDPHVHTAETSRCGRIEASKLVELYRFHGYDGIVITDHLHNDYIEKSGLSGLDWQGIVDHYLGGYKKAKKRADELGLNVLFGIELRFPENESDYLIYGVDEEWLRGNPYINRLDHEAFFKKYGGEVLVIHAHPYRYNDVVYHECVHGVEIVNCNPRHDSRNELALALAGREKRLLRLCGSDTHRLGDEARSGVLFERELLSSHDYKTEIEAGRFRLVCPRFKALLEQSEKM